MGFGLDCGLDYGLDRGLKFGLITIISCCEIKLVLSLQLGCVCELLVDIGSDCLTQIHSRKYFLQVGIIMNVCLPD